VPGGWADQHVHRTVCVHLTGHQQPGGDNGGSHDGARDELVGQ